VTGATAVLADRARAILAANWTGTSTVPSRTLYPHQWGWDAAYIAVGWAHVEPAHAAQELRSILRGQWSDGKVPHIVFDPSVADDAYFPGPAFWRSEDVPRAPAATRTSGITQPPLHARAALEIAHHAGGPQVLAALRELYPRLVAQHGYLAGRRDVAGGGLAALVHPWESGLDNTPIWDRPLAAIQLPSEGVRPYRRRDLAHADPAHRPTEAWYDRFVFLAREHRGHGYDDADLRGTSSFLVEEPLFNAITLWSLHALAEIAVLLGEDPAPHRQAAERVHRGLLDRLWDPAARRFMPLYLVSGRRIDARTIVSLAPLLDPDLPAEMVDAIVEELASARFFPPGIEGYGVPTYDRTAADYDARRYWRGPVWVNTNWLVSRGLRQHGRTELADGIDDATLALVARSGFREYFDPDTGEGYGSDDFSWTAALVLDLLAGRSQPLHGRFTGR
jgi:hypothetical protein